MCDCCVGAGTSARFLIRGFSTRSSALNPQTTSAQDLRTIPDVPPPPPPPSTQRKPREEPADGAPELIVLARRIRTLNPAAPEADAVAVRGGRLIAVGCRAEVQALTGPRTRVLDLGERVVLPGFIDPHVHSVLAITSDWLDVGPFTTSSLAEAAEKIRRAAEGASADSWVKASMIDFSLLPGEPFDKHVLDSLSPNNPAIVLEANGHVMHCNSRALELAGLDRETPDPPTARYVRDGNGELTGRLEEPPAYQPILSAMGLPTPQEMVKLVVGFLKEAAEKGCTALHDCGIGALAGRTDLDLLDTIMASDPPVRYAGMLVSTHMSIWEEMGLRPGPRSNRFHLTGVKAWADGSVACQTAYMRQPYLGTDSCGELNYTPEDIEATLRSAHTAGWQVGIHSNGDAAMDVVLEAFDKVLAEAPRPDHRHRIEHASFLHPEHIDRMARLGVSPSFLMNHVHYWGTAYKERLLGSTRTDLLDPCASALRAGLRISLHSDYCVSPIDPLRSIQTAVVRDMRESGGILNAAERIDVLSAIRAVTLDAAWQCQLEHLCGSLEVGKCADMVVLEEDPLEVAPECIASIPIHSTWLDGVQRTGAALEPSPNL